MRCAELTEVIKRSLAHDFSSILLLATETTPWTAEMLEFVASLGPFPHFTYLHVPKGASCLGACCEEAFGNLLGQCPNLRSLRITAPFSFVGHFMTHILDPMCMETLDLTGTCLSDASLGHLIAFVSSLSSASTPPSLKTLLLPSTVSCEKLSGQLDSFWKYCALEHLRCSSVGNILFQSVVAFGNSLVMVSICDAKGLTVQHVKNILPSMVNLLVFDVAGSSDLTDASLIPLLSQSSLHPTLEVFISATGINYFFTGSKERTMRFSKSVSQPVTFSLSLYSNDWACLPLLQYTKCRDMFSPSSTVTLFTVDKNIWGGEPLRTLIFGRNSNFMPATSSIYAEPMCSHISWTIGNTRIAEISVPNNLTNDFAQVQWMVDGDLIGTKMSATVSNTMKINLTIPFMPNQQVNIHSKGGASDFKLAAGFSISYWAVAALSFMRQLLI